MMGQAEFANILAEIRSVAGTLDELGEQCSPAAKEFQSGADLLTIVLQLGGPADESHP